MTLHKHLTELEKISSTQMQPSYGTTAFIMILNSALTIG